MTKGVLVVAHGSQSNEWQKLLSECLDLAGLPTKPSEVMDYNQQGIAGIALLDADFAGVSVSLGRLQAKGAAEIKLIPLFVCDASSHLVALASFCAGLPGVSLGSALNNHQFILEILRERYLDMAQQHQPKQAAAILVGHGAAEPELQRKWSDWAAKTAEGLFHRLSLRAELQRVMYASVYPNTLTAQVTRCTNSGWTPIILPLVLSQGLITRQMIPQKLIGLPYLLGSPYLPHRLVSEWLKTQISGYLG